MSGGRVTDTPGRTAVASLVTVGAVLIAAGRASAGTGRRFDRQLIAIPFPPRTEPLVRLLYRVDQARTGLTSTAATSSTCPRPIPADRGRTRGELKRQPARDL